MTTLFCASTPYSGCLQLAASLLPPKEADDGFADELAAFNLAVCQRHYPGHDELSWKPFTPDASHAGDAGHLLEAGRDGRIVSGFDTRLCLLLDFWQHFVPDAVFVLAYSNPEHEIVNYLHENIFDTEEIEKLLAAWITRSRAMLQFYLNHREKSLLLNVQTIANENEACRQVLKQKLGTEPGWQPAPASPARQPSALLEYFATSLLSDHGAVDETFDELRSAASLISEQEEQFTDIRTRNKTLATGFLDEVSAARHLRRDHDALKEDITAKQVQVDQTAEELNLKQLQINQILEELEFYYKKSNEQAQEYANYLGNDPLLKLARYARREQ